MGILGRQGGCPAVSPQSARMGAQLEHAAFYPRTFKSDCEDDWGNRGESGGFDQKALMLRPGGLRQLHRAVLFYSCCSVGLPYLRPLLDDDAATRASRDKSRGDRKRHAICAGLLKTVLDFSKARRSEV